MPFFSKATSVISSHDLLKFQECRSKSLNNTSSAYFILVNVSTQHLHVCQSKKNPLVCSYPISSGLKGVGQEENSEKTPLGLHEIVEKIGDGAHPLAIFKSRVETGAHAAWNAGDQAIVGRILRLKGKEAGHNLGKRSDGTVVDSYERFIYIHGTNDVAQIGTAVSQGCIRMRPQDVIELFSFIPLYTPVFIYV